MNVYGIAFVVGFVVFASMSERLCPGFIGGTIMVWLEWRIKCREKLG